MDVVRAKKIEVIHDRSWKAFNECDEFTSSLIRMNKARWVFVKDHVISREVSTMGINKAGFLERLLTRQSNTFWWSQPHLAKTSSISNSDNYVENN